MPRTKIPAGTAGPVSVRSIPGGRHEARASYRDLRDDVHVVRCQGRTQKAAREACQQRLERILGSGGTPDAATLKLSVLLDEVLEDKRHEKGVPVGTVQVLGYNVKAAKVLVGDMKVADATASVLDRLLRTLADTPSKRKAAKSAIAQALDRAVTRGILPANPARTLPPAPRKSQPPKALSPAEMAKLRGLLTSYGTERRASRMGPAPVVGDHVVLFDLLAATGLRLGEALGLRWRDVHVEDLSTAWVEVSGQLVTRVGHGTYRQGTPKTDAGNRRLSVSPEIALELRQHHAEQPSKTEFVIASATGGAMPPASVYRRWRAATVGTPLEGAHPHQIRKTVGTWTQRHEGLEAARQQLGHASVATTERSYVQRDDRGPEAAGSLPFWGPDEIRQGVRDDAARAEREKFVAQELSRGDGDTTADELRAEFESWTPGPWNDWDQSAWDNLPW